ncbi:MAG: hypothetical protein R3362_12445 [Rhodothermales bacterium]|nr:hypothetical protein [Rhodothermales bacterium]
MAVTRYTRGNDFDVLRREMTRLFDDFFPARRGNDEERAFWRRTLEDQDRRDGDLEAAIALLDAHGALRDTVERASHYGAIARDALGIFPESEIKRALLDAIDFTIDRVS